MAGCAEGVGGGGGVGRKKGKPFFVLPLVATTFLSMAALPSLSGGSPSSVGDPTVLGVLTVSDRASGGVYEDRGGPEILRFFHEAVVSP